MNPREYPHKPNLARRIDRHLCCSNTSACTACYSIALLKTIVAKKSEKGLKIRKNNPVDTSNPAKGKGLVEQEQPRIAVGPGNAR